MPWGRLDDSLYDHPKLDLIAADDRLAAIGLWARAISWCNRFLTDGLVPRDRVAKLDGTVDLADQLVAAGLFEPASHGYQIHDFLEFNDSREDVVKRRADDAARKAAYRAAKASGRSPTGTSRTNGTDVPPGVLSESHEESWRPSGRSPSALAGARARRRAPAASAHPDPTRPDPVIPPSPPPAGDRPSRANGTNPRAVATRDQAKRDEELESKRWRRQQRYLAYSRGALTEAQRIEQDERDAPLDDIPDWVEYRAKLNAEAEAPSPIEADVAARWAG